MSTTTTRYLVRGVGRPLERVTSAARTDLGPTDLLVRIKAIAINPADVKTIDAGHRIDSWPIVPGLDGSGIVEAVGSDARFAPGDEVMGMFQLGEETGSYQTLALAQSSMLAMKPKHNSFEEAASLPVSYFTAVMALGIGFKAPLPFIKGGSTDGYRPTSVLVLGGSSALGAAAIQLLKLSVPECTILTTSSRKHFQHLKAIGVHIPLDRAASSIILDVKAATSNQGVDAILDVVGAGASQRAIFDTFDPSGPKKYAQVWTGDDEIEVPPGVESILFRGRDYNRLQGAEDIMASLRTLVKDGKYKLPLPVKDVGNGLEGLRKGVEMMRKGVSGEKLVVSM